jgi:hypothetical protein
VCAALDLPPEHPMFHRAEVNPVDVWLEGPRLGLGKHVLAPVLAMSDSMPDEAVLPTESTGLEAG